MRTITDTFEDFTPLYDVDLLASKESLVFLDIETTGLTAKNSNLYMIGCAFYKDDTWQYIQWFAEKYEDELQILTAFFEYVKDFKYIVHYNGNTFDIPYLLTKCEQYELSYNFDGIIGIDIYRRLTPYKDLIYLENLKQTTVEDFLGIKRTDKYTGRELISIYHDYVCTPDEESFNDLVLHNKEDLLGMIKCLPMLAYSDIFNRPIRVMKAQANYFTNDTGMKGQELILKLRFESALPVPVSFRGAGCYFSGEGIDGSLKIPLYNGELKYYYSNYKNYYYLPAEDIAMHKSVATFVDKAHRIQATAKNCYTRKRSLFLPEWDLLFTPFFKKEYNSKSIYFELTDEFKKNRSGFGLYASHVLSSMFERMD